MVITWPRKELWSVTQYVEKDCNAFLEDSVCHQTYHRHHMMPSMKTNHHLSSCCRRYITGAQHRLRQFSPFIHPTTWLSPCVRSTSNLRGLHEFTPSYLDCSAGVDLLVMKTVPLLAVLVLQRQRTNCVLFLLYTGWKRADGRSLITFRMLLWCFCSLSRSVGRATLTNLWMGASRRLSVSLLLSSAMCPADCLQPTPLWKFEAAPAQFYLTAPTVTITMKVGFWYESMQ